MRDDSDDGLEAELIHLGVPEPARRALGPAQTARLLAELDRFHALGFGQLTARRFLAAMHPALRCRTPNQALADGDLEAVIGALHETLRAIPR